LVSADDGAIADGGGLVYVDLKLSEELRPHVLFGPVPKPVVDGLPVPEALWEIAPRDAGLGVKHYRVDEQAISARRLTTLRTLRNQRLQSGPLLIGERVAVHVQL
jgi:hypothetical protein